MSTLAADVLENRRISNLVLIERIKSFVLILLGIISAAFGLKAFLLPNGFLDGGAMGISLLLNQKTGIEVSIWIIAVNLPFILAGYRQISKSFAYKTLAAITLLAVAVHFVDIQSLTNDKLLISIFGGFFLGAGIGLAIRGGCVIDGTEVLAIYISKKSSLSVGDFIAIFNIVLFLTAAFLINIETALYSMLTYFSASKTVDFIITGIEEYIGVTIVSTRAEEVRQAIVNNLGRAVTVFKGEGGYGSHGEVIADRNILFSVVTRLEVQKLILEIQKIDEEAFVVQSLICDTKGGMIKKRPLH